MFYSPTPEISILLAMTDERNIVRIPLNATFETKIATQQPVVEKIIEIAKEQISQSIKAVDIHYWHQFSETLSKNGVQRTLFVAQVSKAYLAPENWQTFPEFLKSLPQDRNRLPWLKAWQVFAAGFQDACRVFETDDIDRWIEKKQD